MAYAKYEEWRNDDSKTRRKKKKKRKDEENKIDTEDDEGLKRFDIELIDIDSDKWHFDGDGISCSKHLPFDWLELNSTDVLLFFFSSFSSSSSSSSLVGVQRNAA